MILVFRFSGKKVKNDKTAVNFFFGYYPMIFLLYLLYNKCANYSRNADLTNSCYSCYIKHITTNVSNCQF